MPIVAGCLYLSNHRIRKITVLPREELKSQLARSIGSLINKPELSDFTVFVEDEKFYLHQVKNIFPPK